MFLRIETKAGRGLRVAEKPEEVPIPKTKSEFTPENGWLEYFLFSFWGPKRPIFRCEVLLVVSGRVVKRENSLFISVTSSILNL